MKHVHGQDIGLVEEYKGSKELWNVYLRKSYLKTASLMAKGARAAVVLGGAREGELWKEVAYAYGRNVGIAFQVGSTSMSLPDSHFLVSSSTTSLTTKPAKARLGNLEEQTFILG